MATTKDRLRKAFVLESENQKTRQSGTPINSRSDFLSKGKEAANKRKANGSPYRGNNSEQAASQRKNLMGVNRKPVARKMTDEEKKKQEQQRKRKW